MKKEGFPLVSVVVITYNQKEFLRECIDSILAQDYPNFEIIVADDASIDGTQDMLREYNKKHPDLFKLELAVKNQGITANSNAGHFACSGKYIAWMGGDDLMLPGKISKQVQYMENNPQCTICYHQHEAFDSKTGERIYLSFKRYRRRSGDVRQSIRHGTFNGALATMVRRSKTPKTGFDESIPVASDWLFWVESLANGGTIEYIDEVLSRYRRHDNNVTRITNQLGMNKLDHLNSCNILIKKYPNFYKDIMYRYGSLMLENRRYLPYNRALWVGFKLTWRIDAAFGLILSLLTFGVVRK